MTTMWNWFWGIQDEPTKPLPTIPPEYARPTLFIYTYDNKTRPEPPVDVEFDITPEEHQDDKSYQLSLRSDMTLGENSDLPILQDKAVKMINKRLAKLAADWELDRQLSLDMAAGDEGLYGDEVVGKGVMRSTVDVAGGSAPRLKVACICGGGYRRCVVFGEMLAKHDWPKGWVVKLKHKNISKSARHAGSETSSVRSGAKSLYS